jgi:hypothetical protein
MNLRTTRDGPFAWESKAARRRIRARLAAEVGAPDVRATALGVYSALAEAASDAGADSFTVSLARLGELAAMNEKTIRRRLRDLVDIELVTVETAALRAPSRFTLLAVRSGNGSERSGVESERLDSVENSRQVRGTEEKENKGTEETGDKGAARRGRVGFSPPTQADWIAYAVSIGFPADQAAGAFDHYVANGWKVGRNPMMDWKAACRTCFGRWKKTPPVALPAPPETAVRFV